MSEFIFILICIIVIFIGGKIRQSVNEKKKIRNFIESSWGELPENSFDEYDYKGFSQVFRFHEKKGSGMTVDDITWNDLELDNFYSLINNTITSMGDTILYWFLRNPLYDRDKFTDRIQTIDYWAEHREDRERTQRVLAGTGKFRPGRIDVLIDQCDFLEIDNQWGYKLMTFAPLLALPLSLVNIGYGVLWIILSLGANALYHEYKAKEVHLGLEAVTQASKIVALAKRLYENKPNGLPKKYGKLKELFKTLKPILGRGSFNNMLMGFTGNLSMDILAVFKMVFLIDLWLYQSSIKFIETHHEDLASLIEAIGEIDASISIASYREYLSNRENLGVCCKPEIRWDSSEAAFHIQAQGVVHPLIKNCTPNPIHSVKPTLLTGSNASGKSTYLKTVVINTLLVHTLGFCLAEKWISKPLFPITSMALRDSIINGESYFIAEIKSLKRIFSRVNNEITCLCVIDEVLRGTNTIERIAASSQLLYALARENTCIFAATHDIELTYILSDIFENKHFEEDIDDDDIQFDYKLKEGKATSRNAIKLLKIMGFDYKIVENANDTVETFEKQNQWTKIEGEHQ